MYNTIPVAVTGNLTDNPELRYTPAGIAVAKVTVASTPRVRKGEEWADGEPTFLTCTVWRQQAENVAESLTKGARVLVTGRLRTERWEKDGEKRSRVVLDVDSIGPELTYATAKVTKTKRHQGDPDDPWATASKTRPPAPVVADDDEPPF